MAEGGCFEVSLFLAAKVGCFRAPITLSLPSRLTVSQTSTTSKTRLEQGQILTGVGGLFFTLFCNHYKPFNLFESFLYPNAQATVVA
jgi:hypothetical protein